MSANEDDPAGRKRTAGVALGIGRGSILERRQTSTQCRRKKKKGEEKKDKQSYILQHSPFVSATANDAVPAAPAGDHAAAHTSEHSPCPTILPIVTVVCYVLYI